MRYDFVLHRSPKIVRHAKAPIVSKVTRAVRDKLGLIGKCVDVLRKLSAAHLFVNRFAVAYDVQIVVSKINEIATIERPYRSAPNVPFQRDLPIEHRGATGNFSDLQLNMSRQDRQRFANARTGKAPVDRKQLANQPMKIDRGSSPNCKRPSCSTLVASSCLIVGAEITIRQQRPAGIICGQGCYRFGPRDTDRRVIIPKAVVQIGHVLHAHQIFDDRIIRQRLEAMSEARRNVKHGGDIGGQLVDVDFAPCRRILSQIDNDVMNTSAVQRTSFASAFGAR